MTLALYTHLDMLDHQPGHGHVESPERLSAVIDALNDDPNLALEPRDAPLVDVEDLLRVHPAAFVDAVFAAAPSSGRRSLDPDTVLSTGSLTAARRAAGACAAAGARPAKTSARTAMIRFMQSAKNDHQALSTEPGSARYRWYSSSTSHSLGPKSALDGAAPGSAVSPA